MFRRLWKELLPNVVTCRPMTDLCGICQANMSLIYRSVNVDEEEKRLVHHRGLIVIIIKFTPVLIFSAMLNISRAKF